MARKRIGEILLERGLLTVAQLEEGLSHQRQNQVRLGVALIQKGFIQEDQLCSALAEALDLATVDLDKVEPEWSAIHTLRPAFCERHDLFPYAIADAGKNRKQLLVAMSDPLNLPALEEIEFTTGLTVSVRLSPLSQIRAAILRYYHKVAPDTSGGEDALTIIQRGGVMPVVPVDAKTGKPSWPVTDDADEVIEGEEVGPGEVTDRTSLAELIARREQQIKQKRAQAGTKKPKGSGSALSKDLDYLFGVQEGQDRTEQLERKFWALMRIMAKKGLISKDEFTRELDEE